MNNPKAVVMFSGGIDSTTNLYLAKQQGYDVYALSFDYGQRHCSELNAAKQLVLDANIVDHIIFDINLAQFGHSALTDTSIDVPEYNADNIHQITSTYVPARNTIFLSIALGYAETVGAEKIFFGGCLADRDGFPDCRLEYIEAFEKMANLSTQAAIEGKKIIIERPFINLTKTDTIKLGLELGVNYAKTITCYQADSEGKACGHCESCGVRRQAFLDAGIADPTNYK